MPFLASAIVSLSLLVAGVFVFRRAKGGIVAGVLFGTVLFASFALYVFYVVADRFTGRGIDDAVIYHLAYGLGGAGFGDYRGMIIAGSAALIGGLALSYGAAFWRRENRRDGERRWFLALAGFALALASFAPNPAVADLARLLRRAPPQSANFYRYYREPRARATRDRHPNLIFIYAEGFERTYFDQTLFPGLVTGLHDLETQATTFTNIRQVGETGYTIAGIVASQCGVPMFTDFYGNRMSSMDTYLVGARGLGDVLHDEGYHLCFLGGAPLWFAGKGKFFKTHKFDEVLGRDELAPRLADPSYQSAWGLYDDSLLEIAYQHFSELSANGQPFGLFFLTLDTHQPRGHHSKAAEGISYRDGENPMLNAVAASDRLLAGFIRRVRESPYADRTVIVVASDHLAMNNTASDFLKQRDRRDLFMVLEPGVTKGRTVDRLGSTLDTGATALSFLGFETAIGLGRNLLDPRVPLADTEFIQDEKNLASWRADIMRLWDFPRIEKSVAIDIAAGKMQLDERTFGIPALIRLTPKLETNLEFPFNQDGSDKAMIDSVRGLLAAGTRFILIDHGANAKSLDASVAAANWCLLAGDDGKIRTAIPLGENRKFTRDEIERMFETENSQKK